MTRAKLDAHLARMMQTVLLMFARFRLPVSVSLFLMTFAIGYPLSAQSRDKQATPAATLHYNTGLSLLRGDPAAAEAEFRKALALSPETSYIRADLAAALAFQGRQQEAIVEWRTAVDLVGGYNVPWQLNIAQAYFGLRRYEDSIAETRRLMAAPEFSNARADFRASVYDILGMSLGNLGKAREALDAFEAAVRLAPDNPDFRQHLEIARGQIR